MSPEAHQRAYDWIDVREDLLSRVASLDPKVDSKNRNIRPMYSHLLQALRRATITLIRIIAGGQDIEDGKMPDTNDCRGCFMWKGINYLAKIWYVVDHISSAVLSIGRLFTTFRLGRMNLTKIGMREDSSNVSRGYLLQAYAG